MSKTASIPFKGWTPLPHWLFQMMRDLTEAQLRLLLCIVRHTFGWHREEVALSIPLIAAQMGMHESSVRRARVELEEKGVLSVSTRTIRGRTLNVFRIVGVEPVPPTTEADRPAPPVTPCTVHGDPMHRACHAKKNFSIEKEERQQHGSTGAHTVSHDKAVPPPAQLPVAVPFDRDLTEEQKNLFERLRAGKVGGNMARRLVTSRPAELILQALKNLPHRKARRPAALLVAELLEGGWDEPKEAVKTGPQPTLLPPTPRERENCEEARRRQEDKDREKALRENWERMSYGERQEILAEARRRIEPWAGRIAGALEEGSPILGGAIAEVLSELCHAGERR